ncbi:EamA family transporter [Tumebacillus sp. ITR2]|uniref:EamA family transporter n=1 Tax=Tumebacillus amylolyticus TaxID=2801339 RepID=A0ABS1JAB3_9BACL|nr:DMT family transporter [Tumebacillus amylolyticus]MBL0387203.1 EamA family transporter [Tumebacillus amylolyticus]
MAVGYVFVIAAMLIWGSVGIFGRWAHQDATVIVFFRVLSAFVVLTLYQMVRGNMRRAWTETRGRRGWVMFGGVVLALNWIFFFTAVQLTSVANAVLSYYLAPVIVTLLTPLLLQERLERRTLFAVGLAFLGTIVMNPLSDVSGHDLLGIGAGITAAVFYALVTIAGKKVSGVEATTLTHWQTGVAVVVLTPYVLWQGLPVPSSASLLVMCAIGVIHTALALTLYFLGLRRVKVQHVGVLGYLDPVSAILFAFLFLGEIPGLTTWIGGTLILVSSYLILRVKEAGSALGEQAQA